MQDTITESLQEAEFLLRQLSVYAEDVLHKAFPEFGGVQNFPMARRYHAGAQVRYTFALGHLQQALYLARIRRPSETVMPALFDDTWFKDGYKKVDALLKDLRRNRVSPFNKFIYSKSAPRAYLDLAERAAALAEEVEPDEKAVNA